MDEVVNLSDDEPNEEDLESELQAVERQLHQVWRPPS